jgi:hypothetical protein
MSRATYNVVTDARRQAKESAEKGRVFALFLRVHYSDVFPEAGTVVAKKRARKKSKKDAAENDVVQKDAAQGAAQKQTQTLPLAAQANPTPPTGVRSAAAPCWLPREILELIIGMLGKRTLAEVLREKQRGLHFTEVGESRDLAYHNQVKDGFPCADDTLSLYQWHEPVNSGPFEGVMPLVVKQRYPLVEYKPVKWTVRVDLARVSVGETGDFVEVPESAIAVSTNARDLQREAKLTDARLEEMQRFRLRATMLKDGSMIFYESGGNLLGKRDKYESCFKTKTGSGYTTGMVLDSHAGIAVGDKVRILKAYRAYEHFAVDQEGVVRGIALQTFVLYYVELGDANSDISKRVTRAHEADRGVFPGQAWHHVECQRFMLQLCA